MSGLHLSVSPVEEFVFVDSPITLTVKLHEEDAEIDSTEFQLRLLATFADEYSEDESQCGEFHADFIEIISCGTIDSGAAGTNVIFKVNKVSANYEGKKFIVIVEAFQLQGVSNVYTVASNPFFSVKHKLIITEENAAPYSWYKDEGGKDKCIELLVSLVDANQQLVVNRSVPIRVVLVYQGGQPVEHQEILQISPDSASTIKAGIGRIRVRINEVSTRHRGQLFQVLITPDVLRHPALGDIAHIHCTPVEVKSKRNTIRKVTGDVRNIELAYPMKRQRLAGTLSWIQLNSSELKTFL